MKKTGLLSLAAILVAFFLGGFSAFGADAPVKREMRSAWVATVWRLDWPSTTISSTGNTTQINRQKADMTQLLDSLQKNNFNAINFQVRSRCDAMYKSSFEPWSEDLVSRRGLDPGWDPLEWITEECHKRGMECHAWVNPYRYESVIGQWTGENDYRYTHPEWLLDVNGASILNPGIPEVTERIVEVIREIVKNYDIDGVLFDDYFYLSGTPTDSKGDGDQYDAYKAEGGTLSHADWRRDNVNNMVKSVYAMIQAEKPWVRFGVSPAGIACTNSNVAKKYGISACPTGSDWQYNDIYSDPIAWLYNRSIDFISPQIYWTIGNVTDFDQACKWWSEVAAKFGRHHYTSHSISSLTGASKSPALSNMEQGIAEPMATGPNASSFEEYSNEIRLNREYSLNDAPGAIFYSCKYIYKTAPLFGHHLKKTVFNTPALVPAMTYKTGTNPGLVKNLTYGNGQLSWNGYDNVRYTVYAVPTSVPVANFDREPEYLLGVSYSTVYDIPMDKRAGHNLAVCVLDRMGNEYSPAFLGHSDKTLPAPELAFPTNGQSLEAPFEFRWNPVTDAAGYGIEISTTSDFSNLIATRQIYGATTFSTAELEQLPLDTPLYWRVRSMGNGYNDGISAGWEFTASQLLITYPASEATGVSTTPVITWNPVRNVTVEIASDEIFDKKIYTGEGVNGSHMIPEGYLSGMATYYLRLTYVKGDEQCVTPVVVFTTAMETPVVPSFSFPADGGAFNDTHSIVINKQKGHTSIIVEMAASSSFPSRERYSKSLDFGQWEIPVSGIKIKSKELVEGTVYYIRARARYADEEGKISDTAYAPTVAATYLSVNGVEGIGEDSSMITLSGNILNLGSNLLPVEIYTPGGTLVANFGIITGEVRLPALPQGIYLVKAGTTVFKAAL